MTEQTAIITQDTSDSTPAQDEPATGPLQGAELPTPKLTQSQLTAFNLICDGVSLNEVAAGAGVNRSTLWRWRKLDPNFMAALSRWRSTVLDTARDRLMALCETATDAVRVAVESHEPRLSAKILEKMGCMKPGNDTQVDPYSIFGLGVVDQAVRGPTMSAFQEMGPGLTPDQREHAARLFALGVVVDNLRAGRSIPEVMQKLAGPIDDLRKALRPDEPEIQGLGSQTAESFQSVPPPSSEPKATADGIVHKAYSVRNPGGFTSVHFSCSRRC